MSTFFSNSFRGGGRIGRLGSDASAARNTLIHANLRGMRLELDDGESSIGLI